MTGAMGRRQLLIRGAGAIAAAGLAQAETTPASAPVSQPSRRWSLPVKAFCVDFNWGEGGASPPGMYAQADPAEHVRWYRDLGANVIQTFCVSYNGYAWYPSGVAPVTPGLQRPNFLGDMADLGHRAGMKVMGYFCLGANPYWEARHTDRVHHDDSDYIKIPLTLEYLDYFCRGIEDVLRKVNIDGFMIDWVRPTQHKNWLDCEKQMYRELLSVPFPESGRVTGEDMLRFDRLAIARAWRHIRRVVRATRPVVIWTNHPIVKDEYTLWRNHPLLQEVDWVLNESPELESLEFLGGQVGPDTLIVQNLCGWEGHDATAWKRVDARKYGLYGFAKADPGTTLPGDQPVANARNIQILREAYHSL